MNSMKKELITTFMHEAKRINDLGSGLNYEYKLAIGLVNTCIPFEAFINELMLTEPKIWKKRDNFSDKYQKFYTKHKNTFTDWVNALKKELDENGKLQDMTPNSSRRFDYDIKNTDDLKDIIRVIYRVRSNLVHGSKSLTESRNKILIENSFKFLYNLLSMIFAEEKII